VSITFLFLERGENSMKKVISCLMVLCLTLSLAVPAFASNLTSTGDASVPVTLTSNAATFSVTVPTALPISVDAAGVVSTANDVKIINNSPGAVKVTNMTISSGEWTEVDYDTIDVAALQTDSHVLAMEINGDKTTADNTISFTESNWPALDGVNATDSDELPINYNAKLSIQTETNDNVTIATVVFTIGWDKA
jgi:hypothetical protein